MPVLRNQTGSKADLAGSSRNNNALSSLLVSFTLPFLAATSQLKAKDEREEFMFLSWLIEAQYTTLFSV